VANDGDGNQDVFLRDWQQNTTSWISSSVLGNGWGGGDSADVSSDGSLVAFESMNGYMQMGDEHNNWNIFLKNVSTGDVQRVTDGNNSSFFPRISNDGRFVVFTSTATDLVSDDKSGVYRDAFVHDTNTGVTHRLSVSADGDEGNGDVIDVAISGDGHFAAFSGGSNNLVSNDTNSSVDVFVTPLP
jgi:Tol biopolymer transport system component